MGRAVAQQRCVAGLTTTWCRVAPRSHTFQLRYFCQNESAGMAKLRAWLSRSSLLVEILHELQLAVRHAGEPPGHAAILGFGHVHVVTVGRAGARTLGEHHGQAALDDLFGRAIPRRAFVLRALAALTEGAVGGA